MAVFPVSDNVRLIEEILVECWVVASYETIFRWSRQLGAAFARSLHCKPAKPGDVRPLNEVRIVIDGRPHGLWRAVDQDGYVLDDILQTCRNTKTAKRLLNRLLKPA